MFLVFPLLPHAHLTSLHPSHYTSHFTLTHTHYTHTVLNFAAHPHTQISLDEPAHTPSLHSLTLMHSQKCPTHSRRCPTHSQRRPTHSRRCPTHLQRRPTHSQRRPTHSQTPRPLTETLHPLTKMPHPPYATLSHCLVCSAKLPEQAGCGLQQVNTAQEETVAVEGLLGCGRRPEYDTMTLHLYLAQAITTTETPLIT